MRAILVVCSLVAAGCAVTPPGSRPAPRIEPLPTVEPPSTIIDMVGWRDDHPLILASAYWDPGGSSRRLQAAVLDRVTGDRKEVVVALVQGDRLAGVVPLASILVGGRQKRTVGAVLTELPLDATRRALRVDVRTFEAGESQLFAVKTTFLSMDGDTPVRMLERLVESGDRLRDRRADISVKDVDGDGVPELIFEEHESGMAQSRTLVYRRGPDGRYVTKERSIFDE